MPFDLLGYRDKHKDYYGDKPLEDVAKEVYTRTFATKYPDYDSWKQDMGIAPIIQRDSKEKEPSFFDKLISGTSHVAPSSIFPSMNVPVPSKPVIQNKPNTLKIDRLPTVEEEVFGLTKLEPDEEQKFKSWYKGWSDKLKLDPNPDDPRHFYDYRAAYKSGAEPTPESGWHWPSQFKRDNHPNRIVDGVDTKTGEKVNAYTPLPPHQVRKPGEFTDQSTLSPSTNQPMKTVGDLAEAVKPVPALAAAGFVEAVSGAAELVHQPELAKRLRKDAEVVQKYVAETYPVERGSWTAAVRNAFTSIYTQLPLYAIGFITGGATLPLTIMGTQQGLQSLSDYVDKDVSLAKAVPAAAVSGLAEVIGEKLPFTSFQKMLKADKGMAKHLFGFVLGEQGGEQFTTAVQYAVDTVKPDVKWDWDEYLTQVIETAKATTVQVGVMGIGGSALRQLTKEPAKMDEVRPLTDAHYHPNGGTNLIDSAMGMIQGIDEYLATQMVKPKVIVCIQTDGEENASKEHTWEELNTIIKARTEAGWQFNFMGAGIDAYKQSQRMGIAMGATLSYNSKDAGATRAAFLNSAHNHSHFATGESNSVAYSTAQKAQAGDIYDTK